MSGRRRCTFRLGAAPPRLGRTTVASSARDDGVALRDPAIRLHRLDDTVYAGSDLAWHLPGTSRVRTAPSRTAHSAGDVTQPGTQLRQQHLVVPGPDAGNRLCAVLLGNPAPTSPAPSPTRSSLSAPSRHITSFALVVLRRPLAGPCLVLFSLAPRCPACRSSRTTSHTNPYASAAPPPSCSSSGS